MSDPDYTIPISQTEKSAKTSKTKYGYKVLKVGDIVGKNYQIIKELGSGGFATTYLAKIQNSNGQKCVVKQLQPRFNSPSIWENARERLDTEGMVLQWLGKHPQIPALIDHFDENSQFYLVLEFIEGEEFDREVQRGILNEAQIVRFLCDVLHVLHFVHQQGVIHRDIKPSNLIRRDRDGKIALIDFGAVKEIGTAIFESPQETIHTQVIGTPGYMPPEQNNGKPLYSSDLYALGKTAIYGLTGRSPADWEELETNEMVSWYEKTKISEELATIIQRMTTPRTAERYRSAEEALKDLTPLLRVGTTIENRYLILNYIGGESQIDNYLVRELQDDSQLFYLKILTPYNEKKLDSPKVQAELAATIDKINKISDKGQTLKILDCFIAENLIFIIQEYIEGMSIARLIERQSTLSEAEAIDLLIETSSALVHCHKHKIIHGNIQPSSLLKRKSNRQIILQDFGEIDRFTNSYLNTNLGYIPPEQIAGRITFASDIYALGMTVIHCLTGTIPQKLNMSNQTGEILWTNNVKVNPRLIKIVNKMVFLERQKRYNSADRVLKAVKKLKRKSIFKAWPIYLIGLSFLSAIAIFMLAHWAQRAAILEFYNGDLRLERRQYGKAIEYYNEGLRKIPKTRRQVQNFQQVWLQKAKAYNQLREYENALKTCQEALRYYQSYQLWNCQGLALDNLKQHNSAIVAYDKAIALNPDYVWSWNNRGDAYSKLGEVNKAVSDFRQAIRLSPSKSFVSWNNLGKLYFENRQYPQSINAYQSAIEVKDDYLPALIGLGNAYKAVRKYTSAMEAYDRAIALNPQSYESWYGKALVAESLRDYEEAKQAYQEAIALNPDGESARQGLTRVENKGVGN